MAWFNLAFIKNLKWTLGFEFMNTGGTHNLSTDNRKEIFYTSAHTGVIYDYENNSQRLLQGHVLPVVM